MNFLDHLNHIGITTKGWRRLKLTLFKLSFDRKFSADVCLLVLIVETRPLNPRPSQSAEINGKIIICPVPPQGRQNKKA